MEHNSLYSHKRSNAKRDMRVTSDIVYRANARSMAKAGRMHLSAPGSYINPDGSIEVSTRYRGKRISQRITPKQLNSAFGKAISAYVKKI